ncbi:hypothetical protein AB0F17_56575 [Nonomuraea sp. NPDC026600]|uniref:hypothetical protein n=1 Tax=Nonomuraea sp. NPDC026600 TaxID=3155363 RepID=UPI003400D94D
MHEFLERLAERQPAAQTEAEALREQIAELSALLSAAEQVLSRLRITRETILEMTGDLPESSSEAIPLPPAYQQILAVVEQAPDGLRAKDICRMLNRGLEPKHTENMRAKLKRLVSHGILIEPEPGLFTLPRAIHHA